MAKRRTTELTAGVFLILCLVAFLAVMIWLAGVDFGGDKVYLVIPVDEGNTGVTAGSEVFLGSQKIGQVQALDLTDEGTQFLVTVQLDAEQTVYADAVARAEAPPLSGSATVVFYDFGSEDAGEASAENPIELYLGPSSLIRQMTREVGFGAEQRTQVQNALADLSAALANIRDISETARAQLTPGEGNMLADLQASLAGVRSAIGNVQNVIGVVQGELDRDNPAGLLAKVHTSADDVNQTTGNVSAMVDVVRPDVEQIVANLTDASGQIETYTRVDVAELLLDLRQSSTQLVAIMNDFRDVSGTAREVMLLNRDNIDEMIANMTQLSSNLKGAVREIRRSPWRLLGQPSVEDVRSDNIQTAARAFAEGAAELDAALNRMRELAELREGAIPADDPQLLQIRQRIRDAFSNFSQAEQSLWEELAE